MPKGDFNANKTCCPKGHEYDEQNTQLNSLGHRICLACRSEKRELDLEREREARESRHRESGVGYRRRMQNWSSTDETDGDYGFPERFDPMDDPGYDPEY